jgi:Single-stranded DNA-binding protein
MAGLNIALVIGDITEDPKMSLEPSGAPVATFLVDSSDGKAVGRHSVVLLGKMAKLLTPYLRKGQRVWVQGSMKTGEVILARELQFLRSTKSTRKHQTEAI